jgi:hypothetical protein
MGFLVCFTCKLTLSLGNALKDESRKVIAYGGLYRFDDESTQRQVRAVWRLLSEHTGHQLESVREFSPRFSELGGEDENGEDEYADLDIDGYAADFPPWELGTCVPQ